MRTIVQALPSTRPPFLILAPLCVGLGTAVAHFHGLAINGVHFALAVVGAILSAAAVNTLNEYQDFASGLDLITEQTPFSGGSGLLKQNAHLAKSVLRLFQGSLAGLLLIGGYFVMQFGWPLAMLGLLGIAVVVTYTKYLNGSPWLCLISPGLGFGVCMVIGSYLVQGGALNWQIGLIALLPFFTINNLLLVNQLPDLKADRQVGRQHFAIYYSVKAAIYCFAISAGLAVIACAAAIWLNVLPASASYVLPVLLLSFLALPKLMLLGEHIAQHPPSMAINALVANLTPLSLTIVLML
ncbi:prenyltransferase [Pseudoalteromonas piscicida]|uniref:prenyltransferase n=1 Tax=Pseudoalteromonas piscicida TaxID=43662 RepID=UPI0030B3517B